MSAEEDALKVAECLLAIEPSYVTGADHLEALAHLKPYLQPEFFHRLAVACEVCPRHLCDYRICVDDPDTDCNGEEP